MDLARKCSTSYYCIPYTAQITSKFWTLFHAEISGTGCSLALQKRTDVMASLDAHISELWKAQRADTVPFLYVVLRVSFF